MKNCFGIAAFCLLLSLRSPPVTSAPIERGRSAASISSSSQDRHDAVHHAVQDAENGRPGLSVTDQQSHSSDSQKPDTSRSQERTPRSPALVTHWRPSAKGFPPKPSGVASKLLLTAVSIAIAISAFSRLGRVSPEDDDIQDGPARASLPSPSAKLVVGLASVALLLTLGLAVARPASRPARPRGREVKGLYPQMPTVMIEGDSIIVGRYWGDEKGEHEIPGYTTPITFEFQGKKFYLYPSARTAQQMQRDKLTELIEHLSTNSPKFESKEVEWGKPPSPRGDNFATTGYSTYDKWTEGKIQFIVYLRDDVRRALQKKSGPETHMYNLLHRASKELVKLIPKTETRN